MSELLFNISEDDSRKSGIYKIVSNLDSSKLFIGATSNFWNRFNDFKSKLNSNKSGYSKLQEYYNSEACILSFEVVEFVETTQLVDRLIYWTEHFKNNLDNFVDRKFIINWQESKPKTSFSKKTMKLLPIKVLHNGRKKNIFRDRKLIQYYSCKLCGNNFLLKTTSDMGILQNHLQKKHDMAFIEGQSKQAILNNTLNVLSQFDEIEDIMEVWICPTCHDHFLFPNKSEGYFNSNNKHNTITQHLDRCKGEKNDSRRV